MLPRDAYSLIFLKAIDKMREDAPRNDPGKLKHPNRPVTGNLKHNALQYRWVNQNTFEIFMNESVAPYTPYTNEPWISPRWNGTQNPNEQWWQKACEDAMEIIAKQLGGKITKG